jgi:hypothetical protein
MRAVIERIHLCADCRLTAAVSHRALRPGKLSGNSPRATPD